MTPLRYRNILTGQRATIRTEQAERVLIVVEGAREWVDRREFMAVWRAVKPSHVEEPS